MRVCMHVCRLIACVHAYACRLIEGIEDESDREQAWDKVLAHEQLVFARVTPAHKLIIVENNQRLRRIVAVTGGFIVGGCRVQGWSGRTVTSVCMLI